MTHKNEILKWADCPDDTAVWTRGLRDEKWTKIDAGRISWAPSQHYIIDDEYATVRKGVVDKKEIYVKTQGGESSTRIHNPHFTRPASDYSVGPFPNKSWQWLFYSDASDAFEVTCHLSSKDTINMGIDKNPNYQRIEKSLKISKN